MPRPKSRPDDEVLAEARSLLMEHGSLTLAALAGRCGLSASTLVQRFGSKDELVRRALAQAWDDLDGRTAAAVAAAPRDPGGAVGILVALSGGYGDIEAYADGLRILREDLRDPGARARGAAWGRVLAGAIEECFAGAPGAPAGIGRIMIAQWQGALLWWSFQPNVPVDDYVRSHLTEFVSAVVRA
ncbi:TetR/AcrR family transcriptional regulator [Pseudonocardia acaciae]|uniref:TetR/AcrR family transcriptional regulator n=1 Tax=Pseudonocardia acaciae TaxID=551276 RepID=UPI00048DC104|nr:TetR/AcrR family transcriptional regulator [Pseudonocardia acaciae]